MLAEGREPTGNSQYLFIAEPYGSRRSATKLDAFG